MSLPVVQRDYRLTLLGGNLQFKRSKLLFSYVDEEDAVRRGVVPHKSASLVSQSGVDSPVIPDLAQPPQVTPASRLGEF
jgi:hypothetical protein